VKRSNESWPAAARPSEARAGYAEWLALGAVTAGTVGAIVGMATCRKTGPTDNSQLSATQEPESLTAPHGDKLRGAVV
jgi:hypothetical protein